MKLDINPSEYKILIVDDNVFNVQLLVIMLGKNSYRITTATSGTEALQKVESESPDLILLDIMMPDISGYEVAEKLKANQEYQNIPILFLSALNNMEDIIKGFQIGADDYITKPFNKDELLTRITHQISLIEAKRKLLKQNEELKQLIFERDKFYSLIAHDLRSPMGILKMSLNILTGIPEDSVGQEMYDIISMANRTADEMFSMLDNLLKWAKWQMGRLLPIYQKFNIVELTRSVTQIFSTISELRKIVIVFDSKDNIDVNIDIDMIKTVLRNLISNAIKYSPDGSTINVNIKEDDDKVIVSIQDFGRGIKDSDKDKIFDGKSNYTTYGANNEEGSGLGLVLCKEFITKNNGEIWFISKEKEGSTFSFSLPKFTKNQ
ncbi:MAG: hybrid sensor histidine kinase/response regulator [Bacteroidales bacterium]|nr:hybrid sensor histidine kinase/response regulator [Bacteroidales bacterium]